MYNIHTNTKINIKTFDTIDFGYSNISFNVYLCTCEESLRWQRVSCLMLLDFQDKKDNINIEAAIINNTILKPK